LAGDSPTIYTIDIEGSNPSIVDFPITKQSSIGRSAIVNAKEYGIV